MKHALAVALALGLGLVSKPGMATPQISAGLTTGAVVTDVRPRHDPGVALHLGGRFDVLLLRERAGTMALGPYVDVATAGFDTLESGGGLEWLIPTGGSAAVLSAGVFGRKSHVGWEPGASATVFWGSRSFNYHSTYGLGLGLFAQGRYGLGSAGEQRDVILGAQVDLAYLALPFVFAYTALAR